MSVFERFHTIAQSPAQHAQAFKQNYKRPVIGTLCSYAPEEIIWAAGALPFRIWGDHTQFSFADNHLQAYSCSLVRGALEAGLSGKLDFLDGVVFPHTCDSMQRLSDIWRMSIPLHWHADVSLPVKMDTPSARDYLTAVLSRFRASLAAHSQKEITQTELERAITLYNTLRGQLDRLYRLRLERPQQIGSGDVHATVMASMVMDREQFAVTLGAILDALEAEPAQRVRVQKGLVLSGGMCRVPDIYTLIEQAGGTVLWDDMCSGYRYFGGQIETDTEDPLGAIARRYYSRVVCPAKHYDLDQRASQLAKLVQRTNAKGVLFLYLKFCDPHLFDYPHLKQSLDQQNVPSLLMEIDEPHFSPAQFRTRCEAFLEMLA